jgi:hypothetical protein
MDKRISAGISLAVILLMAIFISGALWWSNYKETKLEQKAITQKSENENGNVVVNQESLSKSLNETDNSKINEVTGRAVSYENPRFKFSLEIPKDWENKYKVSENPNSTSGGFDSEGGFISFQLPTTDPAYKKVGNGYAEVFSIMVYPISSLAKLEKNCKATGAEWLACEIVNSQIGKNEKYAFAFLKATSVTDFPKDFTGEVFEKADKVVETFKILPPHETANGWKLISGVPEDTCMTPTYEGEAIIRGWYEWDYSYVEKEWVLKILPQDAPKLPAEDAYGAESYGHFSKDPVLRLIDADPQLARKLKAASKDNPVELTVKGFSAYCEGAPSVSLAPGRVAFKK